MQCKHSVKYGSHRYSPDKMISIKGKAVRFIVRFQKPVMLSQYIHIMSQCEFVSDVLIVLYH